MQNMHIFVTATKLLPPVGTGHLLVILIKYITPIIKQFLVFQCWLLIIHFLIHFKIGAVQHSLPCLGAFLHLKMKFINVYTVGRWTVQCTLDFTSPYLRTPKTLNRANKIIIIKEQFIEIISTFSRLLDSSTSCALSLHSNAPTACESALQVSVCLFKNCQNV